MFIQGLSLFWESWTLILKHAFNILDVPVWSLAAVVEPTWACDCKDFSCLSNPHWHVLTTLYLLASRLLLLKMQTLWGVHSHGFSVEPLYPEHFTAGFYTESSIQIIFVLSRKFTDIFNFLGIYWSTIFSNGGRINSLLCVLCLTENFDLMKLLYWSRAFDSCHSLSLKYL